MRVVATTTANLNGVAAIQVSPPQPEWRPANNGAGKRIWFLFRDAPDITDRYRWDARGSLVRYASYEAAALAAGRLNRGV